MYIEDVPTQAEKIARGKWLKFARETLGYNRPRFARMLGYSGTRKVRKRRMYQRETGKKGMSQERIDMVKDWLANGVPAGAPEPNLHIAREAFWKQYNASKPRVLELNK